MWHTCVEIIGSFEVSMDFSQVVPAFGLGLGQLEVVICLSPPCGLPNSVVVINSGISAGDVTIDVRVIY